MEEQTYQDNQRATETSRVYEPGESKTSKRRSVEQKWVRLITIFLGGFLLLAAVFVSVLWHELQWPKPEGAFDAWDFGKGGSNGVTVPFTSRDGLIHIQGSIGKRAVEFTVDTGASTSIIPKRLGLGTQYADDSTQGDATGTWVWTRPVFFREVQIGASTIHDFSAIAPDCHLLLTPITSGSTVSALTLGNTALSQVVVTIDYEKQRITFQPPQQEALPHLSKHLQGVRFSWPDGDTPLGNGAPFISGEANHYPLKVVLDTGTVAPLVIPDTLKYLLMKNNTLGLTGRRSKTHALFSMGPQVETTPLTISLHPDSKRQKFTLNANAQVATGWSDSSCVLIGEDNFGADIVTIDYPHRTVTIRPSDAP